MKTQQLYDCSLTFEENSVILKGSLYLKILRDSESIHIL
jgi:hypothetical protein